MKIFSIESKIAKLEECLPRALELLKDCAVCPRDCHVDRTNGKAGICGVTDTILVSSANLHYGEEPPISGTRGSGTIFFSGCNLKCVYCQNYPISQLRNGDPVTIDRLAEMMIQLEIRGAHNINFVTPSHYVPQIMAALLSAYKQKFSLPLVYNTSGYDSVSTLKLLDGVIDIYMPDMRYSREESSQCYSQARDYPEINRAAIKEMHRQVGILQLNGEEIAIQGLLIRHLVLPDNIAGSAEIFKFIAEEVSPDTFVSLMSQYFPAHKALKLEKLDRRILKKEYQRVLDEFEKAGLGNGFVQPYGG